MNSPGSVTSQQQEYGGQLYYTPDDLREAYTGGYAVGRDNMRVLSKDS